MPRRYDYDLSHWSFQCGKMFRVTTLQQTPIVAGDSVSLDLATLFRFSPLRRTMKLDARVDIVTAFQPYRHVWTNWDTFIEQGVDENQTLASASGSSGSQAPVLAMGSKINNSNLAKWCFDSYLGVYNRYFRAPAGPVAPQTVANLVSSLDLRNYGLQATALKTPWTTGITGNAVTDDDHKVAVSSSKLDIIDLAKVKARYRTETEREWFGRYYNDVMNAQWGTRVNIDADERPDLLKHTTHWISSTDINGTGDSSLGTFVGKTAAVIRHGMPRRFFPEHGTLITMATCRWPMIHQDEVSWLGLKKNPSYLQIAGDPEILRVEPPYDTKAQEWINGGGNNSLGKVPYGQHYRSHQNFVHANYVNAQGFPFMASSVNTHTKAMYPGTAENWDSRFQTVQYGHYQMDTHVGMMKSSVVPGPKSSIFAGAS